MGLELWHGKEMPGLESLRKGSWTAEVANSGNARPQNAEVYSMFGGGEGGEKTEETWFVCVRLAFLCSKMKGVCISSLLLLDRYSLFFLPGSSLFLPGWHSWDGQGAGQGKKAVVASLEVFQIRSAT